MSNAAISTKKINYAMVAFKPDNTEFNNQIATECMVHELGHVLCLGHDYTGYLTIMSWSLTTLQQPAAHDFDVLAAKYSGS